MTLMSKTLQYITKDALVLMEGDRRKLIERLIDSLGMKHPEPPSREEIDARIASIESGNAEEIPNNEVFQRLRNRTL